MPISIYPPTLKSTQPAFWSGVSSYPVEFTLSKVAAAMVGRVKHIQIRVVQQINNKSIVKTSVYPDGIIYRNITLDSGVNNYSVDILSTEIEPGWEPGNLYKIQLRFGTTNIFTSLQEFATWKKAQIDSQTFSEWSTVMVIKAIGRPVPVITNSGVVTTTSPEFFGEFSITPDSREPEDSYKFVLYVGTQIADNNKYDESPWIKHNSNENNIGDTYRFNKLLEDRQTYSLLYYVRTRNGLECVVESPYTFTVRLDTLSTLEDVTLIVDSESTYCSENGCINVYLKTQQMISGSYVVIRASEKDNFKTWEDLKFILFNKQRLPKEQLIFQDFTIESGVKYRYALQQQNRTGLRTAPLYENKNNLDHVVNFEYSFLYRDDIQLRLQFNNVMSSFKHTVLTSKQDSLGSKYPHLVKNGKAYYAEFPITGLISLYMDEDQTFFKRGIEGYYFHDELVIPNDKFLTDVNDPNSDSLFNQDLTHNNIYIERIFREKVEEFLNDFDYKLYKSATEGNMIIVLQNVQLQPKQELGRMLYSFSATAYEVLENTIQNLNEYKLIQVGEFKSLSETDATASYGQIHGLFTGKNTLLEDGSGYHVTTPENLLDKICAIEEVSIAGGYITRVSRITGLYIEQYPWVDYSTQMLELEAQRANAINQGKDATAYEEQLEYYQRLQNYIDHTPETKIAILEINGQELVMGIGKLYNLADLDLIVRDSNGPTGLQITLKYTGPIIINYTCELIQDQDYTVGIISHVDQVRIWGQISGIFTETSTILKSYNFNYARNKEINRVYHLGVKKIGSSFIVEPDPIIKGLYGDTILDNTTINLYKTLNLRDVIKQETKRQVEIANGIPAGFPNYDPETDQWDNGTLSYKFESIDLIDIETDPGAIICFGKAKDGSDAVEVTIGETGRYILYPAQDLINYVTLKSPHFAIINYKCQTSQMTLG